MEPVVLEVRMIYSLLQEGAQETRALSEGPEDDELVLGVA